MLGSQRQLALDPGLAPHLSVKLLTAEDAGTDYTCVIKLGTLILTVGPCELAIMPKPVIDPVEPQQTIVSGSYRLFRARLVLHE